MRIHVSHTARAQRGRVGPRHRGGPPSQRPNANRRIRAQQHRPCWAPSVRPGEGSGMLLLAVRLIGEAMDWIDRNPSEDEPPV